MEFFDSRFGKLRVVEKDGKKWFIACDVVKALNVSNPYLILAKVHRDDKTYVYVDVASGTPRLIGLTETGLGTFLYRVHKDERNAYVKWLRDEVLPCVRNATLPAVRADTVPDRVEAIEKNGFELFASDEFGQIRTTIIDTEPWFVATDVCKALDLATTATRRLDDDEKGLRLTQTPGGMQNITIVNEPGLYSLILGSRKPEAKAFKRWIVHDVIPALRKHGVYATPQIGDDPVSIAYKLAAMVEEQINKNKELVSQLDDTSHALVAANDEVRRWREQYYKASGKNEHLQKQIEAYHVENSHRKEFTSFINSCVRSFVGNSYGRYIMPTGWSEYYRRLTEAIGDDVRNRGRQPYIDGITDEELPIAMKVAAQMASGELLSRIMSDTIRNAIAA